MFSSEPTPGIASLPRKGQRRIKVQCRRSLEKHSVCNFREKSEEDLSPLACPAFETPVVQEISCIAFFPSGDFLYKSHVYFEKLLTVSLTQLNFLRIMYL